MKIVDFLDIVYYIIGINNFIARNRSSAGRATD